MGRHHNIVNVKYIDRRVSFLFAVGPGDTKFPERRSYFVASFTG